MRYFKIILLSIVLTACKSDPVKQIEDLSTNTPLQLKYAKGFKVDIFDGYKILTITKPWPNASKEYRYLIASNEQLAKMTFHKSEFDAVITDRFSKIVVTSTTHIPALVLLDEQNTLVGFPETDYISSEIIRKRIDSGYVHDIGKNESINTEILLELNPDLVIGFGVEGVNKTFETIKNAGMPVIYNGDWVEASPLAKAEWIKFFGTLFNKTQEADSIFNTIESDYLHAKTLAKQATKRPSILSGALHKDVWYLPNGESPEAQLMRDANLKYLWEDTKGNGSLALSFETVLETAKNADIWLSPSYYKSLDQLKTANTLYANFDSFQNKTIYSFTNTTGETGGVLYYELGTARPDLVLKDLVTLCHPELNINHEPLFFKALQ